jgi:putative transposase
VQECTNTAGAGSARAYKEILPTFSKNKIGILPKLILNRQLIARNYLQRSQLSQTSFYRMIRNNDLLNDESVEKLRHSFAMQFANEKWQADIRLCRNLCYGSLIEACRET